MRLKNFMLCLIIVFLVLGRVNFSFGQSDSIIIERFGLNQIAELRIDDILNPALNPIKITTNQPVIQLKIRITVIYSISQDLDGKTFDFLSEQITVENSNFTINRPLEFNSTSEADIQNILREYGGFLPAGEYEFDIELCDKKNSTLAQLDEPRILTITTTQPPELTYPQDNQIIYESYPNFQWFSVGARPGLEATESMDAITINIRYHLKIAEKYENQTAEEAIDQIPFFETFDISEESSGSKGIINFPYPIDLTEAEPFLMGKTYCWQVQGVDDFGRTVGGAHAKSQVFEFTMGGAQEVEIILEFKPKKTDE